MPKGIPAAGFRRTKRYKSKTLQELEQDIANKAPRFADELEKLVKPFPCPHCGNTIQVLDKDVGMSMLDRALGKPRQKHELDITQNIQLNADQIDEVLRNHLPQITEMYKAELIQILIEKHGMEIRGLLAEVNTKAVTE